VVDTVTAPEAMGVTFVLEARVGSARSKPSCSSNRDDISALLAGAFRRGSSLGFLCFVRLNIAVSIAGRGTEPMLRRVSRGGAGQSGA
jgi:hypothetical protein